MARKTTKPIKVAKGAKPAKPPETKAASKAKPKSGVKAKPKSGAKSGRKSASSTAAVLDRLFTVITARRNADPAHSHSARLLSRGPAKVAQKFGEEAVECLIEAVAGNASALVSESADVLYHLVVMWVSAGVAPANVWTELERREGVSGIAEKASRLRPVLGTTKIP